jgi:hypothetical protein
MKAFVFTDGVIGFGSKLPGDNMALLIAEAPEEVLRTVVSVCARHAYNGKTLLVPGVPEAEYSAAAVDAVLRFKDMVQSRIDTILRSAA